MFSADLGVHSSASAPPADVFFAATTYNGTSTTNSIVNGINFAGYGGMVWQKKRTEQAGYSNNHLIFDTARTLNRSLYTDLSNAEENPGNNTFISWNTDGFTVGNGSSRLNQTGETYVAWAFRRKVGLFDVVTYSANYGSALTVSHGLAAVPQMIIFKQRNGSSYVWSVYHVNLGIAAHIPLNLAAARSNIAVLNAVPTSTSFTVPAFENRVNVSGGSYVAYLFGSLAGISQVGSYTGNGSNQSINCGFAAGARFLLIKRDAATNWYIWDTARGITSGNDPYLIPNTNALEATNDSITPQNEGFGVVQNTTTNINVSGGLYLYLAIA